MTRLIDADALSEKLCETTIFIKDGEVFQRMINDAPTVDAVEVVRCKECTKCEFYAVDTGEDYMTGLWCGIHQKDTTLQGFCSRGKRKGGDDDAVSGGN